MKASPKSAGSTSLRHPVRADGGRSLMGLDRDLDALLDAGLLAVDASSEQPRIGIPGNRWKDVQTLLEAPDATD